jgi:hypothetical protein
LISAARLEAANITIAAAVERSLINMRFLPENLLGRIAVAKLQLIIRGLGKPGIALEMSSRHRPKVVNS